MLPCPCCSSLVGLMHSLSAYIINGTFSVCLKNCEHNPAVPDVRHFRPAGIHLGAVNFVMCQLGRGPKVLETPFTQEFLVSFFRQLCLDERRHVLDPVVVVDTRSRSKWKQSGTVGTSSSAYSSPSSSTS